MSAIRLFGGVLAVLLALTPGAVSGQRASASGAAGATSARAVDNVATILLIDEGDVTRPFFQPIIANFRDVVNDRVPRRALLHIETLGRHLSASETRSQRIMERIADEYAQEPIELLIATGDSSVAVATRIRAQWGRNIPIIGMYTGSDLLGPTATLPVLPNGVQVRLGDMNSATARNMRALIPGLNEVLIVGSTAIEVNSAAATMRPILGNSVRVEGIASPTHGELQQRFALLSEQAAIVYLSVWRDSQGRAWQIREYLRELVEIAPRPVFGWIGSYLGLGIVGGPVLDGSEVGNELGRLAAELLTGADPSAIAPVVINNARVTYDWEPLQRFGIPLRRLPDGATVLNRPLPVWESYPRTTMAVSVLIVVMLVSIGALVYSRRRVQAANAAQLATTRRLLQAQDTERVRIARDLHDDLCQQMAMLAMDVDGGLGTALESRVVVDRVHTLIDRTRSIAVGLHATHIGSMPFREAMASHAASVQARTGLGIQVCVGRWDAEPSPSVALALFRAVQEALQNTVRHADATQVTVSMEATTATVRIEVTDDGIGFDPATTGHTGLGMTSMRERMAIVGGSCSVRSVPFDGTTVVLSAPNKGDTERVEIRAVAGVLA